MNPLTANAHLIRNDIPDMSNLPLGQALFQIAAAHLARDPGERKIFEDAVTTPSDAEATSEALALLISLLTHPRTGTEDSTGLQWLASALSAGREHNLPVPERYPNQSQWNRAMRDAGERLRSAALTLSAGHRDIAREQLAPVVQFLQDDFHNLQDG